MSTNEPADTARMVEDGGGVYIASRSKHDKAAGAAEAARG